MRPRLRLAAALLGAAVLVGAPSADAAEKAVWGPVDLPGGGSAFPTYRDLGADTLQLSMSVAEVAPIRPANVSDPSDPVYRWPAFIDKAVAEGRRSGIEIALLVHRAPSWTNGSASTGAAPDPAAFAAFLTAASRRYPRIRRWMIWGEPNRADSFQPNTVEGQEGPRAYARVLDAAYGALKRANRRNIVIGGMTWTGGTVKPPTFVRFMRLPSGRPPRLDWFGHNPFPFRFPNLANPPLPGGWRDISDLDTFAREIQRHYRRRVKLWLSEYVVASDKRSPEFKFVTSQAGQASYLRAGYRIADSLPAVAGLGWLTLLDGASARGILNYGLLTRDGRRKPSYAAFKAAPGVRFAPVVTSPARLRAAAVAGRGLGVRVRAKLTGAVVVELRTADGRLLRRVKARVRARRARVVRLRAASLRRGRYEVRVTSARAATVRRGLRLR